MGECNREMTAPSPKMLQVTSIPLPVVRRSRRRCNWDVTARDRQATVDAGVSRVCELCFYKNVAKKRLVRKNALEIANLYNRQSRKYVRPYFYDSVPSLLCKSRPSSFTMSTTTEFVPWSDDIATGRCLHNFLEFCNNKRNGSVLWQKFTRA